MGGAVFQNEIYNEVDSGNGKIKYPHILTILDPF